MAAASDDIRAARDGAGPSQEDRRGWGRQLLHARASPHAKLWPPVLWRVTALLGAACREGGQAGAAAQAARRVENAYFGSYAASNIHREMLSDKIRTDAYRQALEDNPSLMKGARVLGACLTEADIRPETCS